MTDDHLELFGDYLESAEGVAEFECDDDCLGCWADDDVYEEDEWT